MLFRQVLCHQQNDQGSKLETQDFLRHQRTSEYGYLRSFSNFWLSVETICVDIRQRVIEFLICSGFENENDSLWCFVFCHPGAGSG